MSPFQSKKAIWWSVGVFLVLIGVFVAAIVLPNAGQPYGSDGPDVDLPSMRNPPENPGTHKMDFDVDEGAEE
jgi:hypothetical protein